MNMTCITCHTEKPETDFYALPRRRGRGECKQCHNERTRAWERAHPERAGQRTRRWIEKNREKYLETRRRAHLRRTYGLSPEIVQALIEKQGGGCGLCGTVEPGPRGWNVDHDHSCCPGELTCGTCVRGILCMSCNIKLGHYEAIASNPRLSAYLRSSVWDNGAPVAAG